MFFANDKTKLMMNNRSQVFSTISWLFALTVFAIGVVNTFWGNDPGFGIFLILLSLVYLPPLNVMLEKKTGFAIPTIAKIALALFIIWASLGVGELFDKINLMMSDL
jgi:hypothetical protein